MLVSVVIPARDAERSLPLTLAALDAQQLDGPFEVIVVDNGSLDGTAELAERHGVRVIRRERGAGPGEARNEGVQAAAADVIAFTDSDCEPAPGWLAAGLAAIAGADLVQGRVEPIGPAGLFDRTLWVTDAWGLFETANLFVRRQTFLDAGGFGAGMERGAALAVGSDRGSAPFGEDVVFGWRAVRQGARTAFSDDALVHHEVVQREYRDWLRERRRDGLFAQLVKNVPELRAPTFFLRYFLNARHAMLFLAILGVIAALASLTPWPLIALLPWAVRIVRDAAAISVRAAAVLALGDVISLAVTLRAGIQAKTILI